MTRSLGHAIVKRASALTSLHPAWPARLSGHFSDQTESSFWVTTSVEPAGTAAKFGRSSRRIRPPGSPPRRCDCDAHNVRATAKRTSGTPTIRTNNPRRRDGRPCDGGTPSGACRQTGSSSPPTFTGLLGTCSPYFRPQANGGPPPTGVSGPPLPYDPCTALSRIGVRPIR